MRHENVRYFHFMLGTLLLTGMGVASAQAQQVTVADYQRAASMLGDRTGPLIDGSVRSSNWLDDGSLVYALVTGGKTTYLRLDPRTGVSKPAFDAQALAAAIHQADQKGKPVDAGKLPVSGVKGDGAGLIINARNSDYRCEASACAPVANTAIKTGEEPGTASPDDTREAFIRGGNLWLRDRGNGKDTQLTFDAKPDFGYATDNAGWKHTDNAVVLWSPDGKKIATFQQDQR
ncbi:MAG: DPP IV N-terminal domain-containing protein, partial [Thermomonas sp.]